KMLIGQQGQVISKIATEAGYDLMNAFLCEVQLKLSVQLKEASGVMGSWPAALSQGPTRWHLWLAEETRCHLAPLTLVSMELLPCLAERLETHPPRPPFQAPLGRCWPQLE
ncbi:hypothetical protein E2320_018035, partial [Naja naja]